MGKEILEEELARLIDVDFPSFTEEEFFMGNFGMTPAQYECIKTPGVRRFYTER